MCTAGSGQCSKEIAIEKRAFQLRDPWSDRQEGPATGNISFAWKEQVV